MQAVADGRDGLLAQAQAHAMAGRLEDADHCCKQYLRLHPNDASALHLAATIARSRGRVAEAIDLLVEAIAQEPHEARHLAALGSSYHALGRRDDALETLKWAESLAPDDSTIQFDIALIEHDSSASGEAACRFRKVLAKDPGHVPAHVLLGQIDASLGKDASARAAASRVQALNSNLPAAHRYVFESMLKHNPTAAVGYLRQALDRLVLTAPDPSAVVGLCRLAYFSLSVAGYWNEATAFLSYFRIFRERWWWQIRQAGISRLAFGPSFIPHRFGETGYYLGAVVKAKILGWFPDIGMMLPAHAEGGANPAYFDYWRQWFTIGDASAIASAPTYHIGIEQDDRGAFYGLHSFWHLLERAWAGEQRPPLLTVSDQHRDIGVAKLRKLGVPDGAWTVVLHVRESTYVEATGRRDGHNAHRNANVLDYLEAVREITSRGGWVLRIGHRGTRALPAMERVVDVAHAGSSPEFDVFLLGTCRFFLGDSSGPVLVATTFGRPIVAANFEMGCGAFQPTDLYLPKLYRDARTQEVLSFRRSLAPPLFRVADAGILERNGVEVVDNSASEIADMAREMLDRLDRGPIYSPEEDALQRRLHELFPAGAIAPTARVGRAFLHAHRHLLD